MNFVLTERMIKTLEILKKEKVMTIKQLAEKMDINERYVRYDIDKINDFLSLNKLPKVEKAAKGYIFLPNDFNLDAIYEDKHFTFSKEDRSELMLLFFLINNEKINLNQLSKKMQVSRSTLKNDMKDLEQHLENYDLSIIYKNGFELQGDSNHYLMLLYQTVKKYNYIFIGGTYKFKLFDTVVEETFTDAFNGVNLKKVVDILQRYLASNQLILSDESFEWYFTNIVIVIWACITSWHITFEYNDTAEIKSLDYDLLIKELEQVMQVTFTQEQKKYISYLLNYTNTYTMFEDGMNIRAETITFQLVDRMSAEMGIDFHSDEELFKGLMTHIAQLIKRIQDNIDISEEVSNILTVRDLEVYEILSRVIKEIEFLAHLENEAELTYITVYFLASIRRIRDIFPKNILLVSGFSYGTSMMLKETLINDFHVRIVDTLPAYLLDKFQDWDQIDLVISSTDIDLGPIQKEVLVINPMMTDEDINKIIKHGINRKKILSHYYSINRNLEFLHEKKRDQVLEVIRSEFGYPKAMHKEHNYRFSDLISPDLITIIHKSESWVEVVKMACYSLYSKNYIHAEYTDEIIQSVEQMGYYSVSEDNFALLHGRPSKKINRSGISLVISKEKIRFGDKTVNIIFCLASKDYKEHIPALISLVRMIKCTELITELSTANNAEEAMLSIQKNERKI